MRKLKTGTTCYESLGAICGSVTLKRDKIQPFGYLSHKKYLNLYPKYGQDMYINSYQRSRCYLDEYEYQKELREEWFEKRFTFDKLMEIMMKTFSSVGSEVKDFSFSSFKYKESDGYFINRWLKVN